jgi:branched-chain amino acid transport system permease protein
MDWPLFLQTLVNSISQGSIYALIAVGLALGFGVMQMANFAHGEFYMLGAYTVFWFYAQLNWPYWTSILLAVPVVGMVGLIVERLIFRPTRGNVLAGFMATAGLALMLQVLVGQMWGVGLMRQIPTPIQGTVHFAGMTLGYQRLLIIPVMAAILIGLYFFLTRAKLGKALRACAQDPEVASLYGININLVTMLSMVLAGAMAGVAGAMMAPVQAVTPYMGHDVILVAFICVIVGGMGSIAGAVLAGFLLGFIHVFATTLVDGVVAKMLGVALMALILTVRPKGLLGRVRT